MSHPSDNADLPMVECSQSKTRCCNGSLLAMSLLTALILIGIGAAGFLLGRGHATKQQGFDIRDSLPLIHASAALSSEKYSLATGDVADDAEGLFVLDHNSGLLQCSVIYPRAGQFMAKFQVNVNEALGAGAKGGQYMMVTGRVGFPRASNRPAAATVVYVMDTATGNYACYGIPFDHTAVARNQPQQGLLILIATGSANPVIDRDDLR